MKPRILVPTDFSGAGKNAFDYALGFMGDKPANFYLLNTYEPPHMGSGMLISINDILRKESESGLNKELIRIERESKLNGHSFESISELGDLAHVVNKYEGAKRFDYIVMGSSGSGGLRGKLFGSNTVDVIQDANTPVLSIPKDHHFKGIRNICMAADLKPMKNRKTIEIVKDLCLEFKAKLYLLHVKSEANPVVTPEMEEEKGNLFDFFSEIEVEYKTIKAETPIEGIGAFLEKHPETDLLYMVPRKENFIQRKFQLSRTKQISNSARLPLLTYKDKGA